MGALYTGDPDGDAIKHILEDGNRRPVAVDRCGKCSQTCYEFNLVRIVLIDKRICLGCLATLTLDEVKAMVPGNKKGVQEILRQLYPDPVERDTRFNADQSAEK